MMTKRYWEEQKSSRLDKEEMKEEVIEDQKEELSAVAPSPLKHNPEAEADNKVNFKISSKCGLCAR